MSARMCAEECREVDLVRSRIGWLLWGTPGVAFSIGIAWSSARPLLWAPALAIAGAACVANAARCRRLHCFITGPLFLVGALATVLDATSVVAFDWRWLMAAVVVGTIMAYGFEHVRGTYADAEREDASR